MLAVEQVNQGRAVGTDAAEADMIQCYFSEIRRYKLLSREEEQEVAFKIKNHNDSNAVHRLVTSNLRLVVKIALKYKKAWWGEWPLLDLIQEGNIGLVMAAKKFDPAKKAKFSFYASFWIKAYILKYIMNNWSAVRLGNTKAHRKLFFSLNREKQKLIDMGLDPQPQLISRQTGFAESEIIYMDQQLSGRDASLNSLVNDDSNVEKIDRLASQTLSPENQVAEKQYELLANRKIIDFKKELDQREVDILESRILSEEPDSLQKIGERYAISRERVRQVEANILKKAKEFFINDRVERDQMAFVDGFRMAVN